MTAREYPLVHRQNDHVFKVQTPRLEQTHDLQSLQGLSCERHNQRGCQAVYQIEYGAVLQPLTAFGQRAFQLVQHVNIHHQEGVLQRHDRTVFLIVTVLAGRDRSIHPLHQHIAEGCQVVQIIALLLSLIARTVHRRREQILERQFAKLTSRDSKAVGARQVQRHGHGLTSEIGLDERM